MAHVITTACIDCKDGACVPVCPVDCIYEGARTLYIHPDECIDCGICVSACPVQAIYDEYRVPPELAHFTSINREFFDKDVSGLGSPGGAEGRRIACDHAAIAREIPIARAA